MKDFITKLKKYEALFLYNYVSYDKIDNKLKLYLFSPDQQHNYLSVELGKQNAECEIGSLIFINDQLFEDTPCYVFELSQKNKKDFVEYHKRKEPIDYIKSNRIRHSFSTENLIF